LLRCNNSLGRDGRCVTKVLVGDTASLTFAIPVLLAVGAGAGFAAGLFGIGGGFVVVPALVFILPLLGVATDQVPHIAVGTSLATIIFTSARSTQSHAARGSVDFGILKSWAPWVVLGTVAGSMIADRISGATLAVVFGLGVLGFAVYFLLPRRNEEPVLSAMPAGVARFGLAGSLGAISALLGIGGGTIATLTMTMCGTPIHRAIGTAAGMGAIIAVPASIGFLVIGMGEPDLPWGSLGYVNVPAAFVIVLTSVVFAPLGVATAHLLSPALLRRVFGIYLILVGATMIAKY